MRKGEGNHLLLRAKGADTFRFRANIATNTMLLISLNRYDKFAANENEDDNATRTKTHTEV